MMNKRFAAFLGLLILLTACSGLNFGQTASQIPVDTSHTGFQGLVVNFVTGYPPNTIFTGTPMDLVVEVRNEGAIETSGTVYLSGYDANLFQISPQQQSFDTLEGKSRFNTIGGYTTVQFGTNNAPINLPRGAEYLDQTFLASVCYPYKTEARIQVCLDPNPNSVLETEACRVTDPAVGGGQGAPVAITAVKETAAPGKVGFLMTISNQGNGQVVEKGSLGNCPSFRGFGDTDIIDYSARIGNTQGTCTPDRIRMSNKQGFLHCTFPLPDAVSPAYKSILEVDLNYAYLSQVGKLVRIASIS